MIKKIILLPFLFLLFLPLTYSYGWGNETLTTLASMLCSQYSDCVNLKCNEEIKTGVSYPSYVIQDFTRMDYYRECKVVSESWCFAKDNSCQDCTTGPDEQNRMSLDAMNFYLNSAKGAPGCDKYREVGKSFNYFLQSKEYWHQVKGEKSECSNLFETDVNKFYLNGAVSGWVVTACSKQIAAEDFLEWSAEFSDIMASELSLQKTPVQSTPQTENQATSPETIAKGSNKCIMEGVKYVSPFCTGSRKIEGTISKWTDPFSILLLIFGIYFLYVQFFKK